MHLISIDKETVQKFLEVVSPKKHSGSRGSTAEPGPSTSYDRAGASGGFDDEHEDDYDHCRDARDLPSGGLFIYFPQKRKETGSHADFVEEECPEFFTPDFLA